MGKYLPTEPYRGTRDFLPEEMSVRQQVFQRLYEVIEVFGYQRYDGPVLELTEIYEAKSSREIVEQQLYTLTDRGGRRLALRPEMTPSVARIIAGNLGRLTFPVRWYSHPNCFRYERPQRGRVREHWQINVDLFGSSSSAVEVEFIELIHAMMAGLGATEDMYVLRMSDRVLLDAIFTEILEVEDEQRRQVAGLLDRWEKYPEDKLRADAEEIGLSESRFARLREVVQAGEEILPELSEQARAGSKLIEVMNSRARDRIKVDPLIVRGFDYYTSTVFEVFDASPQNRRSLFGGGRYDNLVGLYSAQAVPGFGFGMGDVTLMDFLSTHGLLPEPANKVDAVVIPTAEALFEPARTAAAQLRAAGVRTTTPLESAKLGKEIGRADKAGARAVVIIGEQDHAEGMATVRDLVSGEQERVALPDVANAVRKLL
ncbi:histidyl-tRNA synthetase [Saccharomonospora marina XMU15]|uniref:Histidine--tRNA ligase n=1 Tax=Saccharomonospora marina XMU15 TaxID=882083 RepID=H5X408_9PSEU|nr:histidine--tRNA ligase [Saccharomonospora marina]EHR53279.1 histidyl-tRNA synthetase [Saccharomonospora marina XMU15]